MRAAFLPVAVGFAATMRCVAVAEEMRARGHDAVFLGGTLVREIAEQRGFASIPCVGAAYEPGGRQPADRQFFGYLARSGQYLAEIDDTTEALRAAKADVVIYCHSRAARIAALRVGVPAISILQPAVVGPANWKQYLLSVRAWWQWRQVKRSLRELPAIGSPYLADRNVIPLIPPLIHWPAIITPGLARARVRFEPVGALLPAWHAGPPQPDSRPLRDLLQAAERGAPTVYASVGGAVDDVRLVEAIVQAIRLADCIGLVSAGPGMSPSACRALSAEHVGVVPFVPDHLTVLRAADAIVCHCGAQTIMEAVAFGRPVVGVPRQFDQFVMAQKVRALGIGVEVGGKVPRPAELAAAIQRVRTDGQVRQRLARLRALNGRFGGAAAVATAAETLLDSGDGAGTPALR
jgi:UDP:flavonoid glycosyltransferase YjiC (YdhE family)